MPVPKVSVLERVDRKPKFSHLVAQKGECETRMTGEEARRNGPWKGEKSEALRPLARFFLPALHLATILISDVLRVRASSS